MRTTPKDYAKHRRWRSTLRTGADSVARVCNCSHGLIAVCWNLGDWSCEQLPDRFGFHQADGAAAGAGHHGGVEVDAHALVDGGQDLRRFDGVVVGTGAGAVGRADDLAAADI